jgi:hypothetical protein
MIVPAMAHPMFGDLVQNLAVDAAGAADRSV